MTYIAVADLKTHMGISDSGEDTLLTTIIGEAQSYIELMTNRYFETDSGVTHYFTPGVDTRGPYLYLDQDLASIASLVNGDSVTVSSGEYTLYPLNRTKPNGDVIPISQIKLLDSSGKFWTYSGNDAEGTIRVTGNWGYAATVPASIAHITKRLAAWMYRQAQNKTIEGDRPIVSAEGLLLMPNAIPNDIKMPIMALREMPR